MKTQNLNQFVMAAAFSITTAASASAWADVVVVVGVKSAIGNLTSEHASQIFLGKTNTATPIDQAEGVAVRNEFYIKVTNKNSAQLASYRSNLIFSGKGQAPREVAGNGEVKKLLADNPNMIGYIDKNAVDGSVKVVLTP